MKVGVPGEFHEDRWQHSLAKHYPTDLRPVSFRCPSRSSPRSSLNLPPGFQHVAQLSPLAGPSKQFSSQPERQSSARPPRLQASQWHPRMAKVASGRSSPRPPCPQVPQRHPRVAKRASIGTSARTPRLQMPKWHPRGATVSWCIG